MKRIQLLLALIISTSCFACVAGPEGRSDQEALEEETCVDPDASGVCDAIPLPSPVEDPCVPDEEGNCIPVEIPPPGDLPCDPEFDSSCDPAPLPDPGPLPDTDWCDLEGTGDECVPQ